MRYIIIFLLLFSCNVSKQPASGPSLNGTWLPVRQELGGAPLPPAAFAHQSLVLQDSTYLLNATTPDRGVVRYAAGRMDVVGKEGPNAGRTFKALYQLEADSLRICYNLGGDTYPDGFETKGKPLFFLSVFRRQP